MHGRTFKEQHYTLLILFEKNENSLRDKHYLYSCIHHIPVHKENTTTKIATKQISTTHKNWLLPALYFWPNINSLHNYIHCSICQYSRWRVTAVCLNLSMNNIKDTKDFIYWHRWRLVVDLSVSVAEWSKLKPPVHNSDLFDQPNDTAIHKIPVSPFYF